MDTPFSGDVVPRRSNPRWTMPAQQYERSIDEFPDNQNTGGGGGTSFIPPLWLTQASATEVKVAFGQVSGITPTNVDTPIDISGTDDTWSIYMHVTLDESGFVSAVEVLSGVTGVPEDAFPDFYRLIGEADVGGGVIVGEVRPSMAWSQEFVVCITDESLAFYWQVA